MNYKKRAQLQERRAGRDLGGRAIPNSGALRIGGGGDFESNYEHGEAKYTYNDYYVLTRSDIDKLRKQAVTRGKTPVFLVEFKSQKRRFGLLFRSNFVNPELLTEIGDKSVRLRVDELVRNITDGSRVLIQFSANKTKPATTLEVLPWEYAVAELEAIRV